MRRRSYALRRDGFFFVFFPVVVVFFARDFGFEAEVFFFRTAGAALNVR